MEWTALLFLSFIVGAVSVDVGTLPNLQHGIGGTLEIISTTSMRIRNFRYDGQGPGAFLYYYPPGIPVDPRRATSQGIKIILPSPAGDSTGALTRGMRYTGQDLTFNLPAGADVCDISTFTIWCEDFDVFFTEFLIPTSTFDNDGADPCALAGTSTTTAAPTTAPTTVATTDKDIVTVSTVSVTTSTVAATIPPTVDVGSLPNLQHGIGGTLEIISTTSMRIRGFRYDGQGPGAFLYYYPPGVPVDPSRATSQGIKILLPSPAGDSTGALTRGTRYTGQDLTFDLPAGADVCDISTFTIWCEDFDVFFTELLIPTSTFDNDGADPCALAGTSTTTAAPTTVATTAATTAATTDAAPTTAATTAATAATTAATAATTAATATTTAATAATTATGPGTDDDIVTVSTVSVSTSTVAATLPPSVDVGSLPNLQHGIGGTLEIISTTSMRIRGFRYDGQGPGAFLYYYPPGVPVDPRRATSQGIKILLPSPAGDSTGALRPGTGYTGQDLTFDLPAGSDVCDISTFTIWCEDFDVFFTRLPIPTSTFENDGADPCALASTSTTAATVATAATTGGPTSSTSTPSTDPRPQAPGGHDNCAPLADALQLSWTVDRAREQISFMICGCQGTNPSVPQYMGFGLSGSDSFTNMDGADVTISWVDSSEGAMAEDYHLRSGNRVQCRSGLGVCPDVLDNRGTCTDNLLGVSGFSSNRQQCVSFTRPFTTDDADCDLPFDPDNTEQYIVWGVGAIEETAFRHFIRSPTNSRPLHFGRNPLNECHQVPIECELCDPFSATTLQPTEDHTFSVRIGPSGSDRGYMALTGQAGWGIAMYINGALIPELVVERGQEYTFIIETGDDPSMPANYHPFYITSSLSGGWLQNSDQQRQGETVYAGFDVNGMPTATGRLCMLMENTNSIAIREQCGSLDMYTLSMGIQCSGGTPGTLTWTPDENTPDLVYYQCATHRNLGWKIRVVDSEPAGSDPAGTDPAGTGGSDPVFVTDSSPPPPLGLFSLSTLVIWALAVCSCS